MIYRDYFYRLITFMLLSVCSVASNSGTLEDVVCPANHSAHHTANLIRGKRHLNDVLSSSVFKVYQTFDNGSARGVGTATLIKRNDQDRVAVFLTASHIFEWDDDGDGSVWKKGYSYSIEIPVSEQNFKNFPLPLDEGNVLKHPDHSKDKAMDIALIELNFSDDFLSEMPIVPIDFKFDDLDIDGRLSLFGFRKDDAHALLISDIATKQDSGIHYSSERVYDGQSGALLVSDYGVGFGVQSEYEWGTETQKDFGNVKVVPFYDVIDFIMEKAYSDLRSDSFTNSILNEIISDPSCDTFGCLNGKVSVWKINNLIRSDWKRATILSYEIMKRVRSAMKNYDSIKLYVNEGGASSGFQDEIELITSKLLVIGTDEVNRDLIYQMLSCTLGEDESNVYLIHNDIWKGYLTKLKVHINSAETPDLWGLDFKFSHVHYNPSGVAPDPIDILIDSKRSYLAKVIKSKAMKGKTGKLNRGVARNIKKYNQMLELSERVYPDHKSVKPITESDKFCASFEREFLGFEGKIERMSRRDDKIRYFYQEVTKRKNLLDATFVKSRRYKDDMRKEMDSCLSEYYLSAWRQVYGRIKHIPDVEQACNRFGDDFDVLERDLEKISDKGQRESFFAKQVTNKANELGEEIASSTGIITAKLAECFSAFYKNIESLVHSP